SPAQAEGAGQQTARESSRRGGHHKQPSPSRTPPPHNNPTPSPSMATPNNTNRRKAGRPWRRIKNRIRRTATVCALCGEPIDTNLRFPHPRSLSIDHIVPVSLGGREYAHSNVRATHLECNRKRGNTTQHSNPTSRAW